MKLVWFAAVGLLATACGYRDRPADDEVSYTSRTSRGTIVTIHRPAMEGRVRKVDPPSEPVGVTSLTSAEITPQSAESSFDAAATPKDRQFGDRIRHSLASDKNMRDVSLDRVHIVASENRVRLRGTVPTMADKVAIEQRVREVKGVEAVDNDIYVLR